MLSVVRLHHITAHSVTSDRGDGSKHFLFKWFLWEWKAMWEKNPENEEELQQGSHARQPGPGDDETEAHFRTEIPTNLTSPQFIKANPGGRAPTPLQSFHALTQLLISAERWGLKPDKSSPHLPGSRTPSFPRNICSGAAWRFILNLCLCLFVKRERDGY